jgi:hypothetical protein
LQKHIRGLRCFHLQNLSTELKIVLFYFKGGGSMFLLNIGKCLWDYSSASQKIMIIKKQTLWFQSTKRTIPIKQSPLVSEVSAHFSR